MKKAKIENGVVTNIIMVDPENIPEWAASWPEATDGAAIGGTYDGQTFTPKVIPPKPLTNADVNAELQRRVQQGGSFKPVGYPTPIPVLGDDTTTRNLQALAFAASMRLGGGQGAASTPFRDHANVVHNLNQGQVLDLWNQGAAYVSAIFQAAWALKDNPNGVPADFADDVHWPAVPTGV